MDDNGMTEFSSLLHFYKEHTEQSLLPFWNRALDHTHGGVYTCFSNHGEILVSRDKYTWSQGRFLWLWANVASKIQKGELSGDAEAAIRHLEKSVQFLEKHVFMESGNCAFLLTEEGEKKESIPGKGFDISIYADCFLVIGLAAYAGLVQDAERFDLGLSLYKSIRKRLGANEFRSEPYPVPEGFKAHSIPMIMLNVTQELVIAAESLNRPEASGLQETAAAYMHEIMNDFLLESGRVAEMVPEDPTQKDTLLYRHSNPGHTIESMWFVIHTALRENDRETIDKAVRAIQWAAENGWDSQYGGLLHYISPEGGKPEGERVGNPYEQAVTEKWDMKLWWPHSESLYSALLAYNVTGDPSLLELHEKFHSYVFRIFPHPDPKIGEWIQIRDRKGRPLEKIAALPVKDPFHILRNMLLILDLLQKDNRNHAKENQPIR